MIEIIYNPADEAWDVWLDSKWLVQCETERGARQIVTLTLAFKNNPKT